MQSIRFEPQDKCPPHVSLIVGLQGVMLVLLPTVMVTSIAIKAAGLDVQHQTAGVVTAMLICAAVTALQALVWGAFNVGLFILTYPAAMFTAVMVETVTAAGIATFMSLMILGGVMQIVCSRWLPTLRRIVTPTVVGIVTMLVAVSVLPIAFSSVTSLPENIPRSAGSVIAVVTLLISFVTLLSGNMRLRLLTSFVGILAGYATAAVYGAVDLSAVLTAEWFALPSIPNSSFISNPSGSIAALDTQFWVILPSFMILTLMLMLKTTSDGVVIQQGAQRKSGAIKFYKIQSMMRSNGVGMLLAGLCGTLPPMTLSSFTYSLTSTSGVASRKTGFYTAGIMVVLAFCGKLTALLLTIPAPVFGAYLLFAMGILLANGCKMLISDGLGHENALVFAMAGVFGLGLQDQSLTRDIFGETFGSLFGSSVTVGAFVAIITTLLIQMVQKRSERIKTILSISSIPEINSFLIGLASKLAWDDKFTHKLRSVGEETLVSLLALRNSDDNHPSDNRSSDDTAEDSSQLMIIAYPHQTMVELEFIAASHNENIEDQLTLLNEQAITTTPTSDSISLRLLQHHTSEVSHRQFQDMDIVTVRVERGR